MSVHPLIARKDGIIPELEEKAEDVEFQNGKYKITNVPHVVNDTSDTGLDLTIRSSVDSKISEIYIYMVEQGVFEFDFDEYNLVFRKR